MLLSAFTNAIISKYEFRFGNRTYKRFWMGAFFGKLMNLKSEFKARFPAMEMNQACMDVPVYKENEVNEFIWEHCLNLDATAANFTGKPAWPI